MVWRDGIRSEVWLNPVTSFELFQPDGNARMRPVPCATSRVSIGPTTAWI